MKLSAYLSPSRHGIYYFRWPLPHLRGHKRHSIRISLSTRCPDRAGDLARHLASCGRIIRDDTALTRIRKDEARELVRNYFLSSLRRYRERLNDTGISQRGLKAMQEELAIHAHATSDGPQEISDIYLEESVSRFRDFANLSEAQWSENEVSLLAEMRKARRDQLKAFLIEAERLEQYTYADAPFETPAPVPPTSSPLGVAVEEFANNQARRLPDKTVRQNKAYLGILLEYFGPERLMGTITKQDANKVKQVLHDLPSNRKVKTALKGLPLMEAIKVPGQDKISDKTIDSHIQMFAAFFQWAETHGHAPHRLFEGMKLGKRAKKNEIMRKPFTPEQAQRILTELTENTSGLVRSESHKWGMLLAMFTGARLNEICQLHIADVQQEGDIWFLDITDEGDDEKKLKTEAGRRKVPVHSELIRRGFLEFVRSRNKNKRLFPDYNYNVNGGYGRSLGRWCNERFLPELGIKEPGIVFHCFRHTIVTRLSQADVPEPIIQCIVGHARSGVTQEVYMREGYKLNQLKAAIDKFNPY